MRGEDVKKVRDALGEYPGGASLTVLSEDTGIGTMLLTKVLRHLRSRGYVVTRCLGGTVKRRVWVLADFCADLDEDELEYSEDYDSETKQITTKVKEGEAYFFDCRLTSVWRYADSFKRKHSAVFKTQQSKGACSRRAMAE